MRSEGTPREKRSEIADYIRMSAFDPAFENVRRKRWENIAGLSGGAAIPRAPLSSTN